MCVPIPLYVSSCYYTSVHSWQEERRYRRRRGVVKSPTNYMCVRSYICVLVPLPIYILLYTCPHTTICVILFYVLILPYICPHTTACVLILMYVCPHTAMCPLTTIYMCVLMRVKRPTNAYVWHTWVLRELGDVCAVFQFGKLDGNHLSMMLSLVRRDPALWRGEDT